MKFLKRNVENVRKYKVYGIKNGRRILLGTSRISDTTLNQTLQLIKDRFKENKGFALTTNGTTIQGAKWDALTFEKCFFQPISLLF